MIYRIFSSLKTSVYILSLMCLIFLTGTIFPQGENIEDYVKAGGKYVPLVKALDFLDIFMSPLFIAVTALLIVNLAVCLYDRCRIFLRMKRKTMGSDELKAHPHVITVEQKTANQCLAEQTENVIPAKAGIQKINAGAIHELPLQDSPVNTRVKPENDRMVHYARTDIQTCLKQLGFRYKTESAGVKIFEKGLPFWWLSWFYHVGIILAVLGFFLTALFAFENYVVLYSDKPETISLYSDETRWNRFAKKLGMETQEGSGEKYILTLKEFSTEYYQGLKIDYPAEKMERFKLGAGLKKLEPSTKGFSYMPKMWLTHFDVQRPDGGVMDAKLWVNRPFRTGPLTLYQMGYDQKIKLTANGEDIEVEPRVPFQVKDVKGKFMFESLKTGVLFKKDGATERITPLTALYYIPDEKPSEKEPAGNIKLHDRLEAKGVVFEFRDYTEGSVLSYRKDPGVWLVGIACLFVFLGLFVRSLGAWYRVLYAVDGNLSYVLISTRGILADKDRIIKELSQ